MRARSKCSMAPHVAPLVGSGVEPLQPWLQLSRRLRRMTGLSQAPSVVPGKQAHWILDQFCGYPCEIDMRRMAPVICKHGKRRRGEVQSSIMVYNHKLSPSSPLSLEVPVVGA